MPPGPPDMAPRGNPDPAMTSLPGEEHSLEELMQVTSAVGPGASALPDQSAPTAPGPKGRASKAAKAATKPKAVPTKPKVTARVKGPPSRAQPKEGGIEPPGVRTRRSAGVPLPLEGTPPGESAASEESKGDKEPVEEPELVVPLVPQAEPGVGGVPVGAQPPNTETVITENGEQFDWGGDSDAEGVPDDKGEGEPEPEV